MKPEEIKPPAPTPKPPTLVFTPEPIKLGIEINTPEPQKKVSNNDGK